MKKRSVLAGGLIAVLTLSLTGCLPGGAPTTEVPDIPSTEETTATGSAHGGFLPEQNATELSDVPVLFFEHYYRHNTTETYGPYYEQTYERLRLMGQEPPAGYEKLPAILEDLNGNMPEWDESTAQSEAKTYEEMRDTTGETLPIFSDESTLSLLRLDGQVMSVLENSYGFYGGAHGDYGVTGYVYDIKTGNRLAISDVVSNLEDLKVAARNRFCEDYPMVVENNEDAIQVLEQSFDIPDSLHWTMGPESMFIYYNPYEIASYAEGMQVLEFRYEDYPQLFSKGYGASEDDYVMMLTSEPVMVDLDLDGSLDFVQIKDKAEYNEEYDYTIMNGYTITGGEGIYESEEYSYKNEPYLIRSNGHYYLCVQRYGENLYGAVDMYRLNGEEVTLIGSQNGTIASPIDADAFGDTYEITGQGCFYNPNCFWISEYKDVASTFRVTKPYFVSETGEITTEQALYDVTYNRSLVSAMDLDLMVVDAQGNEQGRRVIPAGRTFTLLKTDGETFVICSLEDGTYVRLDVDTTGWPQTIDGTDVEQVFEEVFFAG